MLVYSVAGFYPYHAAPLGDGGPATAASLGPTEGVWTDDSLNVYLSTLDGRVRKVSSKTGIITTIAGTGVDGYSGDGGPATNAKIHDPYGLYSDHLGNVYFADNGNNVIRRVDAKTGIITTIAGGGTSVGDGGPATNAQLVDAGNVYISKSGDIYIGEQARIRKIDLSGIITTIAGNGIYGLSGDGGPATNAQLYAAQGIAIDKDGNLFFADRANSRIRKVNTAGIITSVVGYGSARDYAGDGGPATNALIQGPIGLVLDTLGNLLIADNSNNYIRKVDMNTGIINKIAGVGSSIMGSYAEGIPALSAAIHPEFICIDRLGNIYYANWTLSQIHKITNYYQWLSKSQTIEIQHRLFIEIYPNPTTISLTIISSDKINTVSISNLLGQKMYNNEYNSSEVQIDVADLPNGLYLIRINGTEVRKFVKQ